MRPQKWDICNFVICLGITMLCAQGCTTARVTPQLDLQQRIGNSAFYNGHFTGFSLYDPERQQIVYAHNADKLFTPASNVKLLTFYVAIQVLGDSVPGIKYTIRNDSLIFRGTGDPSFLHPEFPYNTRVYEFLKSRKEKLFFTTDRYSGNHFGPGWAWNDYNSYYSTEISPFPMYGNYVRFHLQPAPALTIVKPGFFERKMYSGLSGNAKSGRIRRHLSENIFTYTAGTIPMADTIEVPFKYSPDLVVELLSDTLDREVTLLPAFTAAFDQEIYSIKTDSLLKRMMQESDNFIAEQMLLLSSSHLFDSISSEAMLAYAKDSLLQPVQEGIRWVDGSGLSRYNMISPNAMVWLLQRIYQTVPRDRLFQLLATGGVSGTLKNWYKADTPYIYAKTGTLNNVHTLSGFLLTKKGKVLIFSFMHNNYNMPSQAIKEVMAEDLRAIHLHY